jgi:predicted dehydrogenase
VGGQGIGPTGVDLCTDVLLSFDAGDAEIHVAIDEPERQWLVVTGENGEIELRGSSYTAWVDDETMLLVSDGSGTRRVSVPPVDAYRLMVEEMSSVVAGGSGWVLPLAESRATAAVLDACFASARA